MTASTHSPFLPSALPAERVVARIGLVSDTHMPERCEALPPALFALLEGIDLVLHAGDVGELRVLDRLSAIAPIVAVHGNDDTNEAQRELPYQQDRFTASILSPELAAGWEDWRRIVQLAPEACHPALLRAARRCWSGEQAVITREELLAELRADAGIPAPVLAQFEALRS